MVHKRHETPNQGATNIWLTPRRIIEKLGPFDLDPCAAPRPRPWPTAAQHYVEAAGDGLRKEWHGIVWVNPPYGDQAEAWLHALAKHGEGIALIFARTDTAWFQRIVQHDWLLFFLAGRLAFCYPDGKPAAGGTAPSVFLAIGEESKRRLRACDLKGFFVKRVFTGKK